MASAMDLSEWENDPKLYLFTSLTAGSSHIITATSRLETILKANRLPFQAIDTATDEKARRLWGRRAGKRKLPGLVKDGYVLGDLEEVEEWNEFGELKENIGPLPAAGATATPTPASSKAAPTATSATQAALTTALPMRQAAAEAASIGAARKGPAALVDESKIRPLPGAAPAKTEDKPAPELSGLQAADEATKPETMGSSVEAKKLSIDEAKDNATQAAKAEPVAADDGDSAPDVPADATGAKENAEALEEEKHNGGSVSEVKEEVIKDVEESTAIPKAEGEEDAEKAAKVEGEQSGEGVKIQEQEGAKAEDAGVSIED